MRSGRTLVSLAQELERQLVDLAHSQNTSTDGSTSIPATFLRVTVSL